MASAQVVSPKATNYLFHEEIAPMQIFSSQFWNLENVNCTSDVQKIISGVKKFENWSLKFLDSSTKIPNGILTGNLIDLGNYDECLQISMPNSNIVGQHCLTSLSINPEALPLEKANGLLLSLTWSYCVPSSCSAQDVQDVINATWFSLTGGEAKVATTDCHTRDTPNYSAIDIFSISFFGVFIMLCLASTIYDCWKKEKKNVLLGSFSIISNGKRLLSVSDGPDTMKPLNGLRFLSIAWVVLGHRYFFAISSPLINLLDSIAIIKDIQTEFISAVLSVDTFFLLSGLLNCYYLLKVLDKSQKFPWSKYYFHRYLRTTPALAIVIFIYSTWFVKIGNGPIWGRTVEPWKKLCVDHWWSTLLYINNYYNPVEQCAGQSWYLAADMQMYWIAPIIILPIWRWPKISNYFFGILLFASTAGQFAVAYVDRIRMSFSISQDLEEYKRVSIEMYLPTHMRATPYIIGLMLGQFLFTLRKSNRKPSVTKLGVLAGWTLSTFLCLTVVLGNYPFMQSEEDYPYNQIESSMYISLHRLAWGAGISWVIFACLYGYGGPVNWILSWDGFVPLGRLTYCIFLTHMLIQMYQLGSTRSSHYFSQFDQVHRYFGDLLMALISSTILCLMFESPIMTIEKYFQTPKVRKTPMEGTRNVCFEGDA